MTITVVRRNLNTSPTSGIQEAIDSLPPEGGVVHVPAGEYPLRRQVALRSGVTLRGDGESTALTRGPVRVFPLASTLAPGRNDLVLAGPDGLLPGDQLGVWSPDPPPEERWAYKGFNMRYLQVERLDAGGRVRCLKLFGRDEKTYRVEHGAQAATIFPALFIGNAEGVTVESLLIDGRADAPPEGRDPANFMCAAVLQYDAPRCRILNVTVRRWNADGICVGGESSDTLISGCICERNHGIGLHPGAGIRDARILGNVSRYNEYGLLFCQGNRNVTVSHNTIHGNEKHGIWGLGEPDRYCIVSDNCVFDNGWHGIEVHGGVGNIIRGNLCRNNSRAEPGRYAGISLRNHRANLVVGNLCLDDQEIPTQVEGIRVEGPADENLLAANAEWRLAPAASSQA